jgi:hypothetical protein
MAATDMPAPPVRLLDSTGRRRPQEEITVHARLADVYLGLRERWWPQVERGMLDYAVTLILVAVVVFVILSVVGNRANSGFLNVISGLGE